ncbi:hypothetical protein LPJ66_005600 [Kickxella alabastrina]|uniref:Uncharacterized protein n=2 Tax=Kickxella alabastrina TaxID=61397 RepID=A0ACC1IM94_9FUNG|nr:hypothetical protein LPJ66_005600 [Kickxella alabastrina]
MSALDTADTLGEMPQKRTTASDTSDESHDEAKRRPGRKPILTEATTKRTAQNRAAQRAFRERKQQYLRTLEEKVQELTEQQQKTERENQKLKSFVEKLKQENVTLKSAGFTFEDNPVEFDMALGDLFESQQQNSAGAGSASASASASALASVGTAYAGQQQVGGRKGSGSPQSVPVLYPFLSGVGSAAGSAAPLVGQDALLGGASLPAAFSSDILGGIQMLASNQNTSSGSFMDFFDSPAVHSTGGAVPQSPPQALDAASLFSSCSTGGVFAPLSVDTATVGSGVATVGTPGDMFVPLSNAGSGFFNMDAFSGQSGFANFASLVQGGNPPLDSSSSSSATPTLSELLAMPVSNSFTDGLFGVAPIAQTETISPAALVQQQLKYPPVAMVGGGANRVSSLPSPLLPAHLMAYRNPDPIMSAADDSDRLEKILLNSIYPPKPTNNQPTAATVAVSSSLTSTPLAAAPASASASASASSSASTSASAAAAVVADGDDDDGTECTCRSCETVPCVPCPKHGSPEELSEELRGMAPQMLDYVCSDSNVMADEELNDLCSLMYKHAKCSEIQRRVEMAKNRIKGESNAAAAPTGEFKM